MNSFIAGSCSKKMSGQELLQILNSYSTRKEYESLIETEKKCYECNFKDDYPLHIKNLRSRIGSFPFRSLICQFNQMNFYSCQHSENDTFIVERFQSVNDNQKGNSNFTVSNENMLCNEIGLGGSKVITSRKHRVTLTTCSCQFYLSWGLPCRHMLRVHFQKNWNSWLVVENEIINLNWFVKQNILVSGSSGSEKNASVSTVDSLDKRKVDLKHWTSLLVECSLKSASDTHSTINLIKDQIKKLTGREDVEDMVVYNNPEINVKQKQKRIMPGDVSAPTSKAYKNSSKKRRTELNEKVKNLKTSIINLN